MVDGSLAMKQHIEKSQWDEVDKKILIEAFGEYGYHEDDIIIGRMIEYLGDEWSNDNRVLIDNGEFIVDNDELCDALWEAVKYKLKQ